MQVYQTNINLVLVSLVDYHANSEIARELRILADAIENPMKLLDFSSYVKIDRLRSELAGTNDRVLEG